MKKVFFMITFLLALLISACSSLPGMGGDDLTGTAWTLEGYGGKDLIPDSTMTAVFEDGQVNGSASCNHYFAAYNTSGNQITIEGLGWTEMACLEPDGIMEQEQAIMALLGSAVSYQIQGDKLVITTQSGEQLIFTR